MESPLAAVLGAKTAAALKRGFGYETVRHLLWHLPRRYSRRGELTPLNTLPVGEHVTIVAQILDVTKRQMAAKRGSILNVRVTDGTGFVALTFFNQGWRETELRPGRQGQFSGKVSVYRGQLQLQHPDYQLFETAAETAAAGADPAQLNRARALAYSQKPVPVYPATTQLPSWVIAKCVATVLEQLPPLPEPLPDRVLEVEQLLPLDAAFRLAHQPQTVNDYEAARASLKFREAFDLQLALAVRKQELAAQQAHAWPLAQDGFVARFDAQLPFQLTGDQRAVTAHISRVLSGTRPLAALLQGEVGSGKTLVALRAMLQVAESGGQSALIAPTEVLAAQHLRSLTELLSPELRRRLNPVLITGSQSQKERKLAALAVASGQALLVVGTHALLSDSTVFANLGLVVIDEQHRFGVEQRETLKRKSKTQPHLLAMTATPIPRTVALTTFGELEVLTLRQLPAVRAGVTSFAVQVTQQPQHTARAWARVVEEVRAGRQVYVVCPAIDTSAATTDTAAAEKPPAVAAAADPARSGAGIARHRAGVQEVAARLKARSDFAGIRVAELTGQLAAADKDRVMRDFTAGNIDVLVATTVIEVGVNVPNANMMLVLEADRFGVSQLHQLRGRVGRGSDPGLCLLMTEAPLGSPAWERVATVAATADGFELAELDLEQRSEGDILGTQQAGRKSTLKLLRVITDAEVLLAAREWALETVAADPQLQQHPLLAAQLRVDAQRVEQLDKA